jgi:HAD superfamily hydrolase (TIGR01509 family)
VSAPSAIHAVVFDMDGVLIDSEHVWDEVREQLARDRSGTYGPEAQRAMMGMSAPEWSAYMRDVVGIAAAPEEINAEVVRRMHDRYREGLPVVPGAVDAVRRLEHAGLRLAVASSSNRELIDAVLDALTLTASFDAVVSSEEVPRGKPAPDVYLEATRRLGLAPRACVAVEDSTNGILAADAAGLAVVAYPNPRFPPAAGALAHAALVVDSLDELTPGALEALIEPD